MVRLLGIIGLVVVLYAVLFSSDSNAMSSRNLLPLTRTQSFYAALHK